MPRRRAMHNPWQIACACDHALLFGRHEVKPKYAPQRAPRLVESMRESRHLDSVREADPQIPQGRAAIAPEHSVLSPEFCERVSF